MCSALKVTAALLFFFDWLLICWQEKRELKSAKLTDDGLVVGTTCGTNNRNRVGSIAGQQQTPTTTPQLIRHDELMSSIISLDRLSIFGATCGEKWNETITEAEDETYIDHDPSHNRTIISDSNFDVEEEEEEEESTESALIPISHLPESSESFGIENNTNCNNIPGTTTTTTC